MVVVLVVVVVVWLSGVTEVVLLRCWCLLGSPFAVVVDVEVDVDSRTCACSMFARISTKSRDFKIK